jgi:hypothetical protein
VLVFCVSPETEDAALVALLLPLHRVNLSTRIQWCDEFIAVPLAAIGKLLVPSKFQPYSFHGHAIH